MSRWRASGIHLLISAAIAAGGLTLMLSAWYPGPLFQAAGGNELLFILVGTDVVIGPLITLAVFKAGKKGMKFDLAVIGILQVCALVYGSWVVAAARPAFIVFVKDRFEVASAIELKEEDLKQAKFPQFQSVPLSGPLWAVVDWPAGKAEQQQLVQLAMRGVDLHMFPRFYAPYDQRLKEVLAKAAPIAEVRKTEPKYAEVIDEWLKRSGTPEASVRYVLLRAFRAFVAVLVDAKTGYPVKMLIVEKI
jgi:hypothetical protein